MHFILAILSVITAPLPPWSADDTTRSELQALQGTWKTVGLEAGGRPLPTESVIDFTFIVGADGKSIGKMGATEYQSQISVDPTKNPMTIDNAHQTGTHQGKKQYGIYKLDGAPGPSA